MTSRGILIAGTGSDVGKSLVTAGICRWLFRRGVRVAPFKAQNMSNNSVVVLDAPVPDAAGKLVEGEIGRAQALQAAACGLQPSVRFNPILLKPGSDLTSQIIALGRPVGEVDAANFPAMQRRVQQIAFDTLAGLQKEFDVVVCEGAGSLAEINLRDHDFVNLGLARKMNWPVLMVGDIDKGGVFASLYGSLALLAAEDQRLVAGHIINKFRGDLNLLKPGVRQLEKLTARPVYGVLPWQLGLWLDSEDSLPYGSWSEPNTSLGSDQLRIAVVRLPHISNATDMDPLVAEPGVQVTFTADPADCESADLVILPGSKSTVADLAWLKTRGLDWAIKNRAKAGRPILGICGGFQMLANEIHDDVESKSGTTKGLGLLPIIINFKKDKTLAWSEGRALGAPVRGYEIHHGYVTKMPLSLQSLIVKSDGTGEGAQKDNLYGTHWHGIFENDDFRRKFLTNIARSVKRTGFKVVPTTNYAELREQMLDSLGELIEQHIDTTQLLKLIKQGAPKGLPVISTRPIAQSTNT